jgi:hypothetical protein
MRSNVRTTGGLRTVVNGQQKTYSVPLNLEVVGLEGQGGIDDSTVASAQIAGDMNAPDGPDTSCGTPMRARFMNIR